MINIKSEMETGISMQERLDKILSHMGTGSRKEVRELVKRGLVTVDGVRARSADEKADPERCDIRVDGRSINYRRHFYVMMHKPAGYLSATTDERLPTVLDLLDPFLQSRGLSPAGRLDRDATGLLLLTDDGAAAHALISPVRHVVKRYLVTYEGTLCPDAQTQFSRGITLDDGYLCLPARLLCTGQGQAEVFLREGKFHQVKRMIAACGGTVTALHRASIGPISLDPALAPGEYRYLNDEEQIALLAAIQSEKQA